MKKEPQYFFVACSRLNYFSSILAVQWLEKLLTTAFRRSLLIYESLPLIFQKIVIKMSLTVLRTAVLLNINSIMLFLPDSFLKFSEKIPEQQLLQVIQMLDGLKHTAESKSFFIIFITRYEGNLNTTCLKRFRKILILKKHLWANFTVAFLDIYQDILFEFI